LAEKELKEVKEKANNLSEKKVDNFLESRKYKQTLPTNDCSFKERAKSFTNQKLLYYLLLFANMSN
jgi:glucose-6-phosphate 1-dehydrogenase